MRDGKLYEELIYRYLLSNSHRFDEENYELIEIYNLESDVWITDQRSKRKRQIDLLVRPVSEKKKYIIECKDWGRRVDSPQVEAFIQKCEGVHANQCIMFSSSGFTESALEVGNKSRGVDLVTMPLQQLMHLLNPVYENEHLVFSCPVCMKHIGFFGATSGSIEFDQIMHIVSEDEKYFKGYLGICDNCFNMFIYTSKIKTINLSHKFVEAEENYHSPIGPYIVTHDQHNTIIYELDTDGKIKSIKLNEIPCHIISSYRY